MKINLSKDHLENGCGLVDGYCLVDKVLYCSYYERSIYSPIDPLYEHFLQLVIEGINNKYEYDSEMDYYICISPGEVSVIDGIEELSEDFCFSSEITEAKEKAIAYVFDNMGLLTIKK